MPPPDFVVALLEELHQLRHVVTAWWRCSAVAGSARHSALSSSVCRRIDMPLSSLYL
jgi:hypothetical protein